MTDHDDQPDVSEEHPESERWLWMGTHRPPIPKALIDQMLRDWDDVLIPTEKHPANSYSAARRAKLSEAFVGKHLVIPTGPLKVRSNDTDYRFRPSSDFFWLCSDAEPDGVLVMKAEGNGHHATLYVEPRGDKSTHRFFTDTRYGEFWRGARRGIADTSSYLDIDTAPIERLADDLTQLGASNTLVVRDIDPRIDVMVPAHEEDRSLLATLADFRLTKDEFEIAQLQEAVDATVAGFEDIVRALPEAMERGERVVEGIFGLRARVEGNDTGYETIVAAGSHSTILHWTRNDGEIRSGDLLLVDAGVEGHNLYTADVTRTMPVSGRFSDAQREIYEIVLQAQRAGIAEVKPGADFIATYQAAMRVLSDGLHRLGILKVNPEDATQHDLPSYRRYTIHGTSHMLGLDVHDCSHARREKYVGKLKEGYVLTVEPGLYFQPNDLTVPEKYRGIGVRIEDDVLVTADGCRVLSAALPTDPDEVEKWMHDLGHNRPGSQSSGLLQG